MKKFRNSLLALLLLFLLSLAISQGEDAGSVFMGLVILAVPTYVFVRYLLPPIWRYIIKPLGKLAYFLLLFLLAVVILSVKDAGDFLGVPEDIRFVLLLLGAIWGGWQWTRHRVRK